MLIMIVSTHTHIILLNTESEANSNTDKKMLSTIVNWFDCYN